MKNILLVVPREESYIHREALIPPGIAYINGALRAAGFPVVCVNLNFAQGTVREILSELISEEDIRYVLSGGTAFNRAGLRDCFRNARAVRPDIICIGGGAGYTSDPEFFLEATEADIAVLGEGEVTETELLQTLDRGGDLSGVKGIVYRDGQKIRRTEDRPVVEDLDDIPFPSYEGLGLEAYFENEKNYDSSALFDYTYTEEPRVIPMFLGRSCPFGCRFCFHTTGRRYRNRSLDNFFAELDMWIEKYRINGILLMDELFGGRKEVILDFCRRIKEYHIPWVAEIRVELADREVLRTMKDSGCSYLQFGLESMSEYVLRDMNKRIRPEQIEQALKDSYDLNIHVFGNFIFGAEAEDWNSFLTTYAWWNRHRKYQIQLLNIMLYPGSEYFKNSLARGLLGDKERFYEEGMPVVNFSRMSEFEWNKMRRVIRMTKTDNVFFGRIMNVRENEEDLSLEIRCCHCGKNFKVLHVAKEKRCGGTDMLSLCTHCGRNNRYNFDDFKDIMTHEIMAQWIENQAEGVTLKNWLKKNGYKKIGLWGNSLLAELFVKNIREDAEILYLSGKNTDRMSAYTYLGKNCRIAEPEEMKNYDADALVVADVSEYAASAEQIRASGYTGRIDSVVNFVFDMEYHLVIPAGKDRREIMEADV